MEEIIKIINLKKTFKLSAKQQKIEKTKEKVKVAVNDISFAVQKGEIFGLLGPNGAGKTTTLRMLATLIKPDSGDAVLNGESIVKNPFGVRGTIGFLTTILLFKIASLAIFPLTIKPSTSLILKVLLTTWSISLPSPSSTRILRS